MQTNRFDAIAAELERLAEEIAAINRQPFDTRIDLRSSRKDDGVSIEIDQALVRDWHLHGQG